MEKQTERFKEGDTIEFDYFGTIKRGEIQTVGDHGYWIHSGSLYGNGSIRCDFEKATLIKPAPQEDKQ